VKPTRVSTLVLVAAVFAVLGWLVLRSVYQHLPPLPWTGVPALLIAAVAEAWTGRDLRARIAARRGSGQGTRRGLKPAPPLFVSRMVALAKASSLAAAIIAGVAAGFDIYLSGFLTASPLLPVTRARTRPFGEFMPNGWGDCRPYFLLTLCRVSITLCG